MHHHLATLITAGLISCTALSAFAAPSEPTRASASGQVSDDLRTQARQLATETPLIDGHNDVPWQCRQRVKNHLEQIDLLDTTDLEPPMHTDMTRLGDGGVGAQFWSVYVPIIKSGGTDADARNVLEQIDVVHRMVARYPDYLEMAYTADDIERIHRQGRVASLIGMEGGHSIANSLAVLRMLYDTGARYMTLTHSRNTDWADSCTDVPVNDGLSPFGREVVREMNRVGMLVDISHVSPATMHDVLDIVETPVIFSHSSSRAICDSPRNVPDDVLTRLPDNGGMVMVTFVPSFISEEIRTYGDRQREARNAIQIEQGEDFKAIETQMKAWSEANPRPHATLQQVADHIDHIRDTAGIDHLGIGGDYDGIRSVPVGLEDVSKYPDLIAELLRRGYSPEDVRKIMGLNLLRVMRKVERAAAELQQTRPASDARIEELDREAPKQADHASD